MSTEADTIRLQSFLEDVAAGCDPELAAQAQSFDLATIDGLCSQSETFARNYAAAKVQAERLAV